MSEGSRTITEAQAKDLSTSLQVAAIKRAARRHGSARTARRGKGFRVQCTRNQTGRFIFSLRGDEDALLDLEEAGTIGTPSLHIQERMGKPTSRGRLSPGNMRLVFDTE